MFYCHGSYELQFVLLMCFIRYKVFLFVSINSFINLEVLVTVRGFCVSCRMFVPFIEVTYNWDHKNDLRR